MTLANSREQRKTAGNRMSTLLTAEEEDDFYKTTYGGFNEVRILHCSGHGTNLRIATTIHYFVRCTPSQL